MSYFPIDQTTLQDIVGFGVAGNFAGHLEQAGETPDFVNVKTATTNAPKGIFPYYVKSSDKQLGVYPLSSTEIRYPENLADNAHLQAEPEVCVLFNVEYDDGKVIELKPQAFAAFNDCSIRKPGAKKISEKKNWGKATKGVAEQFIEMNSFKPDCELDTFRIASFLIRDGQIHAYGKDSSVLTYSYFHQQLNDWMIEKLNQQQDFGPLENLHQILQQAQYPAQIMVSLGATTYTEFGESVFLQPGDQVAIYVYDASLNSADEVYAHLTGELAELKNSSILQQKIV
ncbi:hypothetical protein THMIRHAM_07000 [Thiomicrorhabdus immobilis]|uniref:Uncharacterized protein n=1 Tax=Thiomicrorhabdus immobilis TaxID=2791037 RepID=A0ABM7MC51_9GAMM|nr:DUF5718 family protein [Thiomicrorhabdus immobilis]BCN92915.1 hypothetical protein THMIRHAM_07000 [Thiomicrorhabdus immobilis]